MTHESDMWLEKCALTVTFSKYLQFVTVLQQFYRNHWLTTSLNGDGCGGVQLSEMLLCDREIIKMKHGKFVENNL